MTPRFRLPLSPTGWLVAAAVALVVAIAAANWWNGLWDWLPWSNERRAERAESSAATATSDAEARGLEAEGERAQAGRVETLHTQTVIIREATAAAASAARSAPDAQTPVDPDRAARLHEHDRQLCDAARPGVCGAAASGPAGSGDDALSPDAPAGGAD